MSQTDEYIIAIDAGGTSLKWSLISPDTQDLSVAKQCFQKDAIDTSG